MSQNHGDVVEDLQVRSKAPEQPQHASGSLIHASLERQNAPRLDNSPGPGKAGRDKKIIGKKLTSKIIKPKSLENVHL